MAFADEAVGLALAQQWQEPLEAGLGPGLQGFKLDNVGLVAEKRADLFKVLQHWRHYALWRALGMLGGHLGSV
ncbi:hypothetical protein D3C76_1761810 [compost metagenome]